MRPEINPDGLDVVGSGAVFLLERGLHLTAVVPRRESRYQRLSAAKAARAFTLRAAPDVRVHNIGDGPHASSH